LLEHTFITIGAMTKHLVALTRYITKSYFMTKNLIKSHFTEYSEYGYANYVYEIGLYLAHT